MTQYRVKKVFLFDPETTRQDTNPGKYSFDKEFFVPQRRSPLPRYKWWIKLFGEKEGKWESCAPIDVEEGLCIERNKEGSFRTIEILDDAADRIHWFSERQACEAWIDRLESKQKPEFHYYPQKMNSTYL